MAMIGVTWTFHAGVYPRYSYFRDRLIRLYPRFQRIIEKEQLQDTICQGKEWLQKIQTNTKYLEGPLGITVLYDPSADKMDLQGLTLKHFVVNSDVLKFKKPETVGIRWENIIEEGQTTTLFHPQVIVLCVGDGIVSYDLNIQALSEIQKQNLIIYNVRTKQCERFMGERLISKELNIQDLTTASEIQPLGKLIQEVLEAKPVRVIEEIADYCRRFELHDGQTQSRSLIDEVNHQLSRYLYNKYVIEELGDVKDPKSQQQSTGKSGQENMDVSETQEADQTMPPAKKIKLMDENEKSFECYTKALSRMTKCLICGYLSILYGIPQAVIAAFLSESSFDFENKCFEHMKTSSLKHWIDFEPTKRTPYQKSKFFKEIIVSSFQELLTATQEFVKAKLEVINILNKLQFEIRALLRQTNIKLKVLGEKDLAPSPRLPMELHKELLLLEKVNGCGTIFGKLTLHTVEQMTDKEKNEVDELLEIHRYRHGYSIELIEPKEEKQVKIEPGNSLRSQGNVGSLGCFIRLKTNFKKHNATQNACETNNVQNLNGTKEDMTASATNQSTDNINTTSSSTNYALADKESSLYSVTSKHNFSDSVEPIQVNLKIRKDPIMYAFGETAPKLACADSDIQAIKVNGNIVNECDTRFKSPNGIPKSSFLYEGSSTIAGVSVYKRGSITQLTPGTIISADYRKKVLEKNKSGIINEHYSILIRGNDGNFSEGGDSGSVVCFEKENGSIALLSMVKSVIKNRRGEPLFSNSNHLKRSLEKIAEKNECCIELESTLYSCSGEEPLNDHANQSVFKFDMLTIGETNPFNMANGETNMNDLAASETTMSVNNLSVEETNSGLGVGSSLQSRVDLSMPMD